MNIKKQAQAQHDLVRAKEGKYAKIIIPTLAIFYYVTDCVPPPTFPFTASTVLFLSFTLLILTLP